MRRSSPRGVFGTFLPRLLATVATINTGNMATAKTTGLFRWLWTAEGGGASEASLVFGGDEEQVERGGRGLRVGGGLVV